VSSRLHLERSSTLPEISDRELWFTRQPFVAALGCLTVFSFAFLVAAYFWFIHQYAVNSVFADQWSDVKIIDRLHSGTLTLGTLWAQYGQDRRFFPNLLVVVLAQTTHFNVVVEAYLGGLFLVVATGLLLVTHKLRSVSTPWIFYVPVAAMLFSWVHYWTTLWGFLMPWYVVLLALMAVLFLLDRPTLNGPVLATAIAVAIIGSYSSIQGFLIWPIGALLIYQRRREVVRLGQWIVAAVATGALYFYGWNPHAFGSANDTYALQHPVFFLRFFFLSLGYVVGTPLSQAAALPLGILIFVIAIWLAMTRGFRRDERSPRPIGVALIWFGLLFDLMVATGRAYFGLWAAASSPYSTFNLLVLVGCYLVLIARQPAEAFANEPGRPTRTDNTVQLTSRKWLLLSAPPRGLLLMIARGAVVGVVCLQIALGFEHGLSGARYDHSEQLGASVVLANISHTSDRIVSSAMVYKPLYVRKYAVAAERYHLSLFASSTAADRSREDTYHVAVSDALADRIVNGLSATVSPLYPQEMTFEPPRVRPCSAMSPGGVLAVNPGVSESPGSLRISSPRSPRSTIELLFLSVRQPSQAPHNLTLAAPAVSFVDLSPHDDWLNVPHTHYRAFFLEVTSGFAKVCQSTA
jgi:hypothetical protein